MQKGDLKGCTEALICSTQEQALRTNYIKFHVDKNVESPMCRMCGEKGESVNHLTIKCSKLAQREYKRGHDIFTPQYLLRRKDCMTSHKNVCTGG